MIAAKTEQKAAKEAMPPRGPGIGIVAPLSTINSPTISKPRLTLPGTDMIAALCCRKVQVASNLRLKTRTGRPMSDELSFFRSWCISVLFIIHRLQSVAGAVVVKGCTFTTARIVAGRAVE
jgi:hypothetical protein